MQAKPFNFFDQLLKSILDHRPGVLSRLCFERVSFGPCLTAVTLSDGSPGVASNSTPESDSGPGKMIPEQMRYKGPFSPGRITGETLAEFFLQPPPISRIDSLRTACLNALSVPLIENGNYRLMADTDPFDCLRFNSAQKIVMVGAFRSYIRRLREMELNFKVLELRPEAMAGEEKDYYTPASKAAELIPKADVVIITGMTLVNQSLESLLKLINPSQQVMLSGPSASLIPDVFFAKGISLMGASRVISAGKLHERVAEGASAWHLFSMGILQKITLVNPRQQFGPDNDDKCG